MRIGFLFTVCCVRLLVAQGFEEARFPSWSQSFDVSDVLYEGRPDGCEIGVFENALFGKVLTVNGLARLTDKDEHVYHEMMVHPALLTHGKPLSVLIIGGETGAAAREVLRHIDVERVVLVGTHRNARDQIEYSMPDLWKDVLKDKRLEMVDESPLRYLETCEEPFEIVIYDPLIIKPITEELCGLCMLKIKDGGIVINPIGDIFFSREEFKASIKARRKYFDSVTFYGASIPSFISGRFFFGWTCDAKHNVTQEGLQKRLKKVSKKLRYYTPAIHKGAFALPANLIPKEKEN